MEYLYRCDWDSSGEREIKSVILYETCELGNTDIWEYCLENYKLSGTTKELVTDLIELSCNDEPCYETASIAIDALLDDLKSIFGKEVTHCVWLSDYDSVSEFYGTPTTKCHVSDVILSDLGSDGILYGYFEEPDEIEICEKSFYVSTNC